jgi:hypothetical protein
MKSMRMLRLEARLDIHLLEAAVFFLQLLIRAINEASMPPNLERHL